MGAAGTSSIKTTTDPPVTAVQVHFERVWRIRLPLIALGVVLITILALIGIRCVVTN
jgi:hypothetical protein